MAHIGMQQSGQTEISTQKVLLLQKQSTSMEPQIKMMQNFGQMMELLKQTKL